MCALKPRAIGRTDVPNLYRRALGKYRYTIFYRVLPENEGIEIVRVVHSARVKNLRKLPDV
jgi:plasmid stabilization system protein ParE